MLKDIVVHVDDDSLARSSSRVAAGLAARHGAKLTGVHAISVPRVPPYADVEIPEFVRQNQRAMFVQMSEAAHAVFDEMCNKAGVSSEWFCEGGTPSDVLARHSIYADLVVVRRASSGGTGQMRAGLAGDLALGIRRPVMMVPPDCPAGGLSGPVVVAWNGSPESARALADALPLLVDAHETIVVSVNPAHPEAAAVELSQVCAHLQRHGASATIRVVTGQSDVGQAVLDVADAAGAGLLVLGAYGHSRMREVMFGGVTEFMLGHSELPVLMSH